MKILVACSTIDFKNFVRRATLEAIWKKNPQTDFLFYTGVKNIFKEKKTIEGSSFYSYHFWIPEKFKQNKLLSKLEYALRSWKWPRYFNQYEVVFLSDPNQYYLLPFLGKQKVVYLLRDPNVLLGKNNYPKERKIIKRADLIFAISTQLKEYYLKHFYNFTESNVVLWPNSVDLNIWNYEKYSFSKKYPRPTAGISGNLTFKTDIDLLDFLTNQLKEVNFVIIGKNLLPQPEKIRFERILDRKNVSYLGYLPLEEVPSEVIKWHVGLQIEKKDMEFSRYYNANKVFQYMALGLPTVKLRYNNDLAGYEDIIYEAETFNDFKEMIEQAIKLGAMNGDKILNKAQQSSSEKRAEEFLICLNSLK